MTPRDSQDRRSVKPLKCFDCQREIEVGERYIEDSASGFIKKDADPTVDGLIADIFGGQNGKIVFCADCTEPGGDYLFETFYGETEA